MDQIIMIGCDLHDRSMLLRYSAVGGEPVQGKFSNSPEGRQQMIAAIERFARQHGAERIVFAYEASGLGYGLADLLHDRGIECHVLSPAHLAKSSKGKKQKTDAIDAQMLLEQVRGHVLAGNKLHSVWTPSQRLRDDRELVRARIDLGHEMTRVKLQIMSLLKRRGIEMGEGRSGWTRGFVAWLRQTAELQEQTVRSALEGLLRRYDFLHQEVLTLDKELRKLANTERYRESFKSLKRMPGVGQLTALCFLTEIGDVNRFHNRRELAAYLGLCPSSHESGNKQDRKGHITRQGPSRLRKLLCQAAWASLRCDADASAYYQHVRGGNQQRTKKALVALMRRLAIRMWHTAQAAGVSLELEGRGGPHSPLFIEKQAA